MTVAATGTQAATVTTEHTLNGGSFTDAGTYVMHVNTANMVNGDTLVLRVYAKCVSAGSEVLAYMETFAHVQAQPLKISPPIRSEYSCKFTLNQDAGTSRNFEWAILRL